MTEFRDLKIGDIVQHFKRETISKKKKKQNKYLYKIIGTGVYTDSSRLSNERHVVIYQALYKNDLQEFQTYVRDVIDFISEVDKDQYPNIKQTYRFERYIPDTEKDNDDKEIKKDLTGL